MSKTFKIVLILLVVASIVSAVLAVFAFVGKEREYTKRLLLEDKLAATLKDKRRLEKQIDSNDKAKEKAETKMKKLLSQVDDAKEKSEAAILDLSLKDKELEKLKEVIEKERKEKLSISKELEEIQFSYTRAKSDLTDLKTEKARLERRLSDLKEKSVDLDTIVVNPGAGRIPKGAMAPVKKLLRGKVLVVNREYSFIVTDIGEDDGIKKGMIFEVRDGRQALGKAEVDKVYDTMSSATVFPGSAIGKMKKGDLIVESQ